MDRRTFICTVARGALACPHIAGAQKANKVWRVGFIASGIRPPDGAAPAPLREQLHALGFAEGKDVTYEGRWGEGRNERLRELAGVPSIGRSEPTRAISLRGAASRATRRRAKLMAATQTDRRTRKSSCAYGKIVKDDRPDYPGLASR